MKKIKTIKEFVKSFYDKNEKNLKKDYPGLPFKRFLEEYCEFDNSNPEDDFFMENPAFFEKIKLGVPLEYINFKSYFYSNEFYVNPDVLIPRSETEILVEEAIRLVDNDYHDDYKLCDIGTGSGIIALTIATEVHKKLQITATDISQEALAVASINFENLLNKMNKQSSVKFLLMDRLESIDEKFDLITSNPPYIKLRRDKDGVHEQVNTYEPHAALYLEDNSYDLWFDKLFNQVNECLKENGKFIMEGHEDHLKQLSIIAKKYFEQISIIKDYTQRDRFLSCVKKK